MTLTEPLIRHRPREGEFRRRTPSDWVARNTTGLVVVGCIAFWLAIGTILYFSF
ncbi:MAG: hypothetical protein WDN01_03930 [Rhizomicrobium sp.]